MEKEGSSMSIMYMITYTEKQESHFLTSNYIFSLPKAIPSHSFRNLSHLKARDCFA